MKRINDGKLYKPCYLIFVKKGGDYAEKKHYSIINALDIDLP